MYEYVVAPGWWHNIVPLNYGHEACVPGHTFGPAVRHYYLLHYILKGEGVFHKDGKTHRLQAGDLFIICPEEVTTYCADEKYPWEYVWVAFSAESTPEFLQVPLIRQAPVRQVVEPLAGLENRWGVEGKIFTILYDLLWKLSQTAPTQESQTNTYAAYAKTYLETTYMRRVRIQEIADALHIDRRYLTILFREAFGMSPQEYLMQLRLQQANTFLQQGYGVSEAAAMAGFSDLSNFSRKYKAVFGISPVNRKMTEKQPIQKS